MALLTIGKYPELLITLLLLMYPNFQVCQTNNDKVVFAFPEFPYKDTSKNEMKFHEFESACEQAATCRQLNGVSKIRCIRECVSPSCYRDIYQSDQVSTSFEFSFKISFNWLKPSEEKNEVIENPTDLENPIPNN